MYHCFKERAIDYARQAVKEDNAGNYGKAFPQYMNAIEYLKVYLKYEQNAVMKEVITQKLSECMRRADEVRGVLERGDGSRPAENDDAE